MKEKISFNPSKDLTAVLTYRNLVLEEELH
jgi:hypothetical protein